MGDQRQTRAQQGPTGPPPPTPPPNEAVALLREIRDGVRSIRAVLLFWFWTSLVGAILVFASLQDSSL